MSGIYPMAIFCITGLLWLAASLCGHRLLHAFCKRFPLVAQREIPYAFDRGFAHPEKCIYFFRRKAVEVLRNDPLHWRQRQRFIFLFTLALSLPVLGFVSIAVVALVEKYK